MPPLKRCCWGWAGSGSARLLGAPRCCRSRSSFKARCPSPGAETGRFAAQNRLLGLSAPSAETYRGPRRCFCPSPAPEGRNPPLVGVKTWRIGEGEGRRENFPSPWGIPLPRCSHLFLRLFCFLLPAPRGGPGSGCLPACLPPPPPLPCIQPVAMNPRGAPCKPARWFVWRQTSQKLRLQKFIQF